jgi:hypothetical protein
VKKRRRRGRRRSRPVCSEMRDSSLLLRYFTNGELNINIFNHFVCDSISNI